MKKHWMKWSCMAVLVLTSCQQGNLSEEISTDNLALRFAGFYRWRDFFTYVYSGRWAYNFCARR